MTDIWTLLEQDAPRGCESVQDLYSWSLNFDAGRGPFTLFLDLIGYSEDEYGQALFAGDITTACGYMELSKLGAALVAYSDAPHDVREYVGTLLAAESSE